MATKKADPNKGPQDKSDNDDVAKQLKTLQETLEAERKERQTMLDGFKKLAGIVKNQRDVITELQNKQETSPRKEPQKTTVQDQDIEALPRKDFMELIMSRMGDTLDEKLKSFHDRIESVSSEFETKAVQDEVRRAEQNFADFSEWKSEVAESLRITPTLSVEDAYLLAKSKNPDKAAEVQKRLDAAKKEAEARRASEQGSHPFGGMRPSGGGEVEERDDMEPDEAAEKAWELIEESVGGKQELDKVLGME